jgi:hypothetical protein
MPMWKSIAIACAVGLAVLIISACSESSTPARTDPDGRITFRLPAGWEPARGSSETRFRPARATNVTLQINTVSKGSADIAKRRDAWLEFQREAGAEILYSERWKGEHLDGLAYAHSAEGMTGKFHWHHIVLDGGDYLVTTNLQTPPEASDDWTPQYREMVASIEPATR